MLSTSSASEHIHIVREVLLESGLPAQPNVIIRTPDGDYVIAGHITVEAWATRVSSDGKVKWRHTLPRSSARGGQPEQEYTGAALLKDDSVVLCGFREIDIDSGKHQDVVGVLTHIDKAGKIISRRDIYPNNDKSYRLTYLQACSISAEGIIVSGNTSRFWGNSVPRKSKQYDFSIAIDEQGNIVSEKLTEPAEKLGLLTKTEAALRKAHIVPQDISLIAKALKENKDVAQKAFSLPDGSVAAFGYHYVGENAFSAGVSWINKDESEVQDHVFKPVGASAWVTDAVPTNVLGEFAAVRPILPVDHFLLPDDDKEGIALTFIQFK